MQTHDPCEADRRLRFFWDLDTDQGMHTTDVFDIWDTADPKDWSATATSDPNKPINRLRDAASAEGFLTEWDSEDNVNGIHR